MSDKPIVVDLDGSLIRTDTLMEGFMLLLKKNPFFALLVPFWLLKGKAFLKNAIASRVNLEMSSLPYNQALIEYLEEARSAGRKVYLATGAVEHYANAVSDHLNLFDGVFSSTETENLTGSKKAKRLLDEFGEKGFDYVGNDYVDLKIWQHAEKAVVVTRSSKLLGKAKQLNSNVEQITVEGPTLKTYIKAIRVHQWVKNALIFVPVLTSHKFTDSSLFLDCILGFFSFSLAASSVYVLNDLVDLESDRQHPTKCNRPFASAIIPIIQGIFLFPCLLLSSAILCLFIEESNFAIALACYYVITLAYSFSLKRIIMLDTIVLAALYTMRIIAGTLLVAAEFSFWLLAFSMFIFLSLALVKRYTELLMMRDRGADKAIGRGYQADDAEMVASLGAASGYIAVMVFSLYVNSEEVKILYTEPSILWLAGPILLYWISRVWIIAHRGKMHDDPIVFAVKDFQSIFMGLLILVVFAVAT